MAADSLGLKFDINKAWANWGDRGFSINEVQGLLREQGIRNTKVLTDLVDNPRLFLDVLENGRKPIIAGVRGLYGQGHAVVIDELRMLSTGRPGLVIRDPAGGVEYLESIGSFMRRSVGDVLLFR